MEFFMQEHWSGLPFPAPGNLPSPGMELRSLVSPAFFTTMPPGKLSCSTHSLVVALGLSCSMGCGILVSPPGVKLTFFNWVVYFFYLVFNTHTPEILKTTFVYLVAISCFHIYSFRSLLINLGHINTCFLPVFFRPQTPLREGLYYKFLG